MSDPDMDQRQPPPSLPPPSASASKDKAKHGSSSRSNRRKTQSDGSGGGPSRGPAPLSAPPPSAASARPQPQSQPRPPRSNQARQVAGKQRKPELGSVYRPGGSKKGDLGGLSEVRQALRGSRGGQSWRRGGYPFRHFYARDEGFSKEAFLKARCQFVVSEGVDVTALTGTDPDAEVEWEVVEELRVWGGSEPTACPICLYPPTAGKMARCGHAFCWPCILHYLALSDEAWRKCPICYDPIYPRHLKSFAERQSQPLEPGTEVTLQLMCRLKGSVQALPAARGSPGTKAEAPTEEDLDRYSKVVCLPDTELIHRVLDRERTELEFLVATEGDTPEICFVHQALDALDKRQEDIVLRNQAKHEPEEESKASKKKAKNPTTTVYVDAFYEIDDPQPKTETEREACDSSSSDALPDQLPTYATKEASSSTSSAAYFFYQAADGQPIYLHPLNDKMLKEQYGCLASAPGTLTGTVVEAEGAVVGEAFRKRFHYLGHLPLASSLHFAEINLSKEVVGPSVRSQFAGELEQRAKDRRHRAAEDRRRAEKAARWDRALLLQQASWSEVGTFVAGNGNEPEPPPETVYVPSAQDMPPLPRVDSPPPFNLAEDFGPALADLAIPIASPPTSPPASPPDSLPSVPSFAQMLRTKARPKQAMQATASDGVAATAPPPGQDHDDDEPALPAPSFQSAFGEAMASALSQMEAAPTAQTSGKKKKKKGKGTLLFSM